MGTAARSRVAIACQGGGSHTAFTAGVLEGLLGRLPDEVEVAALSGTSGGALCATLAWECLLHGRPEAAGRRLRSFWAALAAVEPLDRLTNEALLAVNALREHVAMPEVSPYDLPTWGAEHFRAILEREFNFKELRRLARRPGAPGLLVGAVEVLTGHFEIFTGEDLHVECLLASAAIPELFQAVEIPGHGVYWDGLFSQNPPIHDFTDFDVNEIWVIQINPTTCPKVPTGSREIDDRRNRLAGNLSMEQELGQVEFVNRLIAKGVIADRRFRPIDVGRIVLDRELDYRTKLDRRPEFLAELRDYGLARARWFLDDRERRKVAMEAQGVLRPDRDGVRRKRPARALRVAGED